MPVKRVIKTIKQKLLAFKIKIAVGTLRKNIPSLKIENLKQFAKWIVDRDSVSVTFKCSHCGFEYIDADPMARCEYKGCPMCLSIMEGTVERGGECNEQL